MFYVRSRLTDELLVEVDINHENVYTRCADCGAEIQVDLNELIGVEDFHVESAICCEVCSACYLEKRSDLP